MNFQQMPLNQNFLTRLIKIGGGVVSLFASAFCSAPATEEEIWNASDERRHRISRLKEIPGKKMCLRWGASHLAAKRRKEAEKKEKEATRLPASVASPALLPATRVT